MRFFKMQGCGNDYVVMKKHEVMEILGKNTEKERNFFSVAQMVKSMSDRHYGIGADGVLLVDKGSVADFEMEMYNPDGSRGEMCGNGIRCVGKYVREKGLTEKKHFTVESMGAIRHLEVLEEEKEKSVFRVDMGIPLLQRELWLVCENGKIYDKNEPEMGDMGLRKGQEESGKWDEEGFGVACVSMGNPHAVIFPKDWKNCRVEGLGSALERAPMFPNRTNVEFVKVEDKSHILLRVWERGAGETLACGTGACATAAVCMQKGLTDDEITVTLLGGELSVLADKATGHFLLTGPAVTVFEGDVEVGPLMRRASR